MHSCLYSFSSSFFFFFSFFLLITFFPSLTTSDNIAQRILPNFTATSLQFVDNAGAFLSSENAAFRATLHNPLSHYPSRFYFSVVHAHTNIVLWSANRDRAVSNSAVLSLTTAGLAIADANSGKLVWSTPLLDSPVSSLQLLDTGNLVLLGANNVSLWESFSYPTDTFVIGQRLPVGTWLVSSSDSFEFTTGEYRLAVTAGEGLVLQWLGRTYWKLVKDSGAEVSYMEMNSTGLYLYEKLGSVVAGISLGFSVFRIAQLGYGGRFSVIGFVGNDWVQEFVAPDEFCEIPFSCGKLGLCVISETNKGFCTCPDGFILDGDGKTSSCVPRDDSFVLPSTTSCDDREFDSPNVSYARLGIGVNYFANYFTEPARQGVNFLSCRDLCTRNCSCLGFFYGNSSGSCHVLEGQLGSLLLDGTKDRLGYIKTMVLSSSAKNTTRNEKESFPKAKFVLVVTLLSGFVLVMTILVIIILWWNKKSVSSRTVVAVDLERWNSSSSAEIATISLPGLPVRFEYNELVEATEGFKTQIGSGGFGTVYRGTMRDETIVAVKKINNLDVQGKKEFCTEIAIIGSVRHVNLVRLRGFCIHRRQHFLVYEFMSKGSLEKILFNRACPILEWPDRFKIALGTARALAYLHSGCQKKIIHCDIKPENILLNENLQVKISDFGLSKLLDHESSKLLTTMRGTRGYLAPEWLNGSGITDKTDVYSFGMVLLEIVSGKRNCLLLARDSGNRGNESEENRPYLSSSSAEQGLVFFPSLALEMHKQRRYSELADPRLTGQVSEEEIEMMVKIALCCVHIVPMLRPTMDKVVSMLEGRLALCEPKVEALKFLHSFGGKHS